MRILWTGTFVPEFGRNRQLRRFLDAAEVDYEIIHCDLWPDDRVAAVGGQRLSILLRMLIVYPRLFVKLMAAPRPDVYLVSYPGFFDVPVVRLVSILKRRSIVFDIFISLHETIVEDRGMVDPGSISAKVASWADRMSMRWSHRVIADCPAHADHLSELAGVARDRFGIVYLGADEEVFQALPEVGEVNAIVLFYGTFVPLQGVDVIIRAAGLLHERGVQFRLIGEGQAREDVMALTDELNLDNVTFIPSLAQPDLVAEIRGAALCLGVFGTSGKASRVIPHKVFEALACRRPVITAATDAVVGVFAEGEIATVPVHDPTKLAEAIEEMLADAEVLQQLADRGHERFRRCFSTKALGRRLRREIELTLAEPNYGKGVGAQ